MIGTKTIAKKNKKYIKKEQFTPVNFLLIENKGTSDKKK